MKNALSKNRLVLLFIGFISLISLQGFRGDRTVKNDFIAPIENPNFSFFMDFEKSGLSLSQQSEQLSEMIKKITDFRSDIAKTKSSCEPASFFSSIKKISNLKLEKLFFYFETPQNFGVFISGNFPLQHFKQFFPELSNKDQEEFSITIKVDFNSVSQLLIDFKKDLISLCPANSAGNILYPVENQQIKISSKFKAFRKMVESGAALAIEADFSSMMANLKKANFIIPDEFDPISHIRFVSDPRMVKAQIFIPDDEKRNFYNETLKKFLESSLVAKSSFFTQLGLEEKGNSLFLSIPPSIDAVKDIGNAFGGILIHFFACNQVPSDKKDSIRLSKAVINESKNN
jgi:hypothetical protein